MRIEEMSSIMKIRTNKGIKVGLIILTIIFSLVGLIGLVVIINSETYFRFGQGIDRDLADKFGSFFGGFIGAIFGIVSTLLLIYTIFKQNEDTQKSALESNFFRMVDYHNQNVKALKVVHLEHARSTEIIEGPMAFVQFKIQIKYLLELVNKINLERGFLLEDPEIIDIAYIVFFYGIDGSWLSFVEDKLLRYMRIQLAKDIQEEIGKQEKYKLARTNQTYLSTYFRNIYNAVKMIDNSKWHSKNEKEDLIRVFRSQLSNPELYVLFFNVMSRFGRKWKEMQYVTKYELLKNLPKDYCEDYDPKKYFPMDYEFDEY
jgi:uncharacterized membrane protein